MAALRFAANLSFLFTDQPFLDRFASARSAGFSYVECMVPFAHDAAALRDHLDANQLEMVLFSMWQGDYAAGDRGLMADPRRRDEFRRGLDLSLSYAQALRCSRVHAIVGNRPPDLSYEATRACVVENLLEAAPIAASAGVTLTIEPLNSIDFPYFFLRTVAQGIEIVRDVAQPNVKFQFDCYHVQIVEGNLIQRFLAHVAEIAHVQIADVPGRHEPGTGEINYPIVLQNIEASGYDGFVGLEYRPTGSTLDSLSWLPSSSRGHQP